MKKLQRRVLATAGALGFSVLAIGALHMPFARGLLMRVGGCPMAASAKMTPVEMDAARRIAVSSDPGTTAAPARPALAFALDVTTLADVHTWAQAAHVDCDDVHPGLVKCTDVPGVHAGAIDELVLGFNTAGHLVNVTTLRQHLSPNQAADSARDITTALRAELGPSARTTGDFDAAHLARPGAYSTATVSYRFADYSADVMAMNLGSSGTSVREHYMSARD